MRHLFIALFFASFLCPASGQNNVFKTVGVSYTVGAPTFSPGKYGSQVAIDTTTGLWYEHNGTSWNAAGYRMQTISGCSEPNYTPTKYQSRLVINACTAGQGGPELYYWTGSVWLQINESATVSEPENQLVFGGPGGIGVDSDTGATYASRILKAPNLKILPTTNSTTGIIYSGDIKMISFYSPANDSMPTDNIFIGRGAGNYTMAPGHAKYMATKNILIGPESGKNITTGYLNTGMGWESIKNCTTCAGTIFRWSRT